MDLLVPPRDERSCDLCGRAAVLEVHEVPAPGPRSGYRALCGLCLTIELLERRSRAHALLRPLLRAA
jgi:hypothetical protein